MALIPLSPTRLETQARTFTMRPTTHSPLLISSLAVELLLACAPAQALSMHRQTHLAAPERSFVTYAQQEQEQGQQQQQQLCNPASGRSGILLPAAGSTLRVNEPFEFSFCSPTFFKSSSYEASVLLFPALDTKGGKEGEGGTEERLSGLPEFGQVIARDVTVSRRCCASCAEKRAAE